MVPCVDSVPRPTVYRGGGGWWKPRSGHGRANLGTDILPALALSREPAEPGLMDREPRPRGENVIRGGLLLRAWAFLGMLSAVLVLGGFVFTLWRAGWSPGAPTGPGTPLHLAYQQATTVAWLGIVACQIGTAFAARTSHASLRSIGVFTNRALLGGVAVALAFAACLVYLPVLHPVFGTAALSLSQVAIVFAFPVIVWGADELRRALRRGRRNGGEATKVPSAEEDRLSSPRHDGGWLTLSGSPQRKEQ